MADENNIEIVDSGAGDVFADEAMDFDIVNGTLRIRFAVARPDAPTLPAKHRLVHIGRLVMPLESAQRMAGALHSFLTGAGFEPISASAPPGQTLN